MTIEELGQKLPVGGMCAMAHKSVGLAMCGVSNRRDPWVETSEREKVQEDALLCRVSCLGFPANPIYLTRVRRPVEAVPQAE